MFYFLFGIYFFYVAAKAILAILQINFIRAEAKKPAVVLEQNEYETAAAAAITNQKFEIVSLFYHAAIFNNCLKLIGEADKVVGFRP